MPSASSLSQEEISFRKRSGRLSPSIWKIFGIKGHLHSPLKAYQQTWFHVFTEQRTSHTCVFSFLIFHLSSSHFISVKVPSVRDRYNFFQSSFWSLKIFINVWHEITGRSRHCFSSSDAVEKDEILLQTVWDLSCIADAYTCLSGV